MVYVLLSDLDSLHNHLLDLIKAHIAKVKGDHGAQAQHVEDHYNAHFPQPVRLELAQQLQLVLFHTLFANFGSLGLCLGDVLGAAISTIALRL